MFRPLLLALMLLTVQAISATGFSRGYDNIDSVAARILSLIHISEPTRLL